MTLPEPGGCPHCGTLAVGYANDAGVRLCLNCRAPRTHAEPGCPVRNAMLDEQMRTIDEAHKRLGPNHKDGCDGGRSYLSGTGYNRVRVCGCGAEDHNPDRDSLFSLRDLAVSDARERRVHDGGPRVITHDLDTGETRAVR